MTNFFSSSSNASRSLLVLAGISALALTACGDSENPVDSGTVQEPTVEATETPAASEAPTAEPTASASADATDSASAAPTESESTTSAAAGSWAGSTDESLNMALDEVEAQYPEAVVLGLDTEGSAYEIDLYDGEQEWEVIIGVGETFSDATTNQQNAIDRDDQAEVDAVDISFGDALMAAEAEGGSEAVSASLDTEAGTVVYSVELRNDMQVSVDVMTGEVTEIERD